MLIFGGLIVLPETPAGDFGLEHFIARDDAVLYGEDFHDFFEFEVLVEIKMFKSTFDVLPVFLGRGVLGWFCISRMRLARLRMVYGVVRSNGTSGRVSRLSTGAFLTSWSLM